MEKLARQARPLPLALASSLVVVASMTLVFGTARAATGTPAPAAQEKGVSPMTGNVRIGYLHHSTGHVVWGGGVPEFIQAWNASHGTAYRITEETYPATTSGYSRYIGLRLGLRLARFLGGHYPWANYPYDYWNLWVAHAGDKRDRGEQNLDDLVAKYDVIVFKHCFPVSAVVADTGMASVSSETKTIANYKLQYEAIKARLHEFPSKRFIVWTGPPLLEAGTNPADAQRAREFFTWVKETWDERGDNIYVWDYRDLAADSGLYLRPEYGSPNDDPHPNVVLARKAAPAIGRRIVDVIEGRGDASSITGLVAADASRSPR